MTDELTQPELGYVKTAVGCGGDRRFLRGADRAARRRSRRRIRRALVFSTKYDPDSPLVQLSGEALDERYFGLHHDLPPESIAQQLGGTLVWKRDDDGMWVALIRFNRPVEARLERGAETAEPNAQSRRVRRFDVHEIFPKPAGTVCRAAVSTQAQWYRMG